MSLNMRQEFLKGYVISLIGEGHMRATVIKSASFVGTVIGFVCDDAAVVIPEVAKIVATQGFTEIVSRLGTIAERELGKLSESIGQIGLGGALSKIASSIQSSYERGREANAKRR